MKDCTNPGGHEWKRLSKVVEFHGEKAAHVQCIHCEESGFEMFNRTCPRCGRNVDEFRGGVCDWCAQDLERLEELAQTSGHNEEGLW